MLASRWARAGVDPSPLSSISRVPSSGTNCMRSSTRSRDRANGNSALTAWATFGLPASVAYVRTSVSVWSASTDFTSALPTKIVDVAL